MTDEKRKDSDSSFFYFCRLAQTVFIQGSALLGAYIIFLHIQSGVIKEEPMLWLGLFGPALLTIFFLTNFPSVEKVKKLIEGCNQAAEFLSPT
jgi:hypothetical protein